MSLATTGGGGFGGAGGGAGGGIALAHHAGGGGAAVQQHQPAAGASNAKASGAPGVSPPVVNAALAADVMDKNSGLTGKSIRSTSQLPLVAVDLFSSSSKGTSVGTADYITIASFPPKHAVADPVVGTSPVLIGKMKSQLSFLSSTTDDSAHKALKKFLTQEKTFTQLQNECLLSANPAAGADPKRTVTWVHPQHWLGIHRFSELPEFVTQSYPHSEGNDPAQAAAILPNGSTGIMLVNSTLDTAKSESAQSNQYNRILGKVKLSATKKPVPMLPEEAVQILFHLAQYHAHVKMKSLEIVAPEPATKKKPKSKKKGSDTDDDDVEHDQAEEFLQYPLVVAVSSFMYHDACIEALYDAASACNTSVVVHQRALCALSGALLPGAENKPNLILEYLNQVRAAFYKEYQRNRLHDPDNATFDDEVVVVLMGSTVFGIECTAVVISELQPQNLSCLYGNMRVISTVSVYFDPASDSVMTDCVQELMSQLDLASVNSPSAMLFYGSLAEQQALQQEWNNTVKPKCSDWAGGVRDFTTKVDAVAMGTAVLGAVSHGRLIALQEKEGKPSSSNKTKGILGIRVQNVTPVAVGVQFNYFNTPNDNTSWTPVKTIFDFDRRVPAGPYVIDLKASESVVHRDHYLEKRKTTPDLTVSDENDDDDYLDDDKFEKATKLAEGSRGIPRREEAALHLWVRVVQKWTRSSPWIPVGDPMQPLVKYEQVKDDDKKPKTDEPKDGKILPGERRVGCEEVEFELVLGVNGMITHVLYGERYVPGVRLLSLG
jgi:hypothetical protein